MTVPRPRPRPRRLALAAAVALSAAGTALATIPAAQAAPAAAAAPAAPAAKRPVLIDCSNAATVKPKVFVIACADGNDNLQGLKWSSWGTIASGTGTNFVNTCDPNCATGHFHKYGVKVKLYRVKPRPHHKGQRYYTRMGLTYQSKVPSGFQRHRTVDLWAKAL